MADFRRIEEGRRDQELPDRRFVPPPVHDLAVYEHRAHTDDGGRLVGIEVLATSPTWYNGEYEVWWQYATEPTTGRWEYGGRTAEFPFLVQNPAFQGAPGSGTPQIRVAVVTRSGFGASLGPAGSPQATVTLDGSGLVPDDVTGFAVAVDQGEVLFTWTAVPNRRDILAYEIRAGTGWLSSTVVGVFGPFGRTWAAVPRSRAAGLNFLIKAVTRSEAYSDLPGSAVLSAVGGACADADRPVEPDEVTFAGGLREITVTTACAYTGAPFVVGLSANASKRIVTFNTSNYAQNGDLTWSFTLRASAVAPAAGWTVHVYGSGT